LNAGVLAFYACPMGSSASGKAISSFSSISSGASALHHSGGLAINSGVNGGASS